MSFFSHIRHVLNQGKELVDMQEKGQVGIGSDIIVKCSPAMREVVTAIDLQYRNMVTERNMADTLLLVAVNPQ